MTLVECLGPRYSVQSIRLAPGRSQENFIVTWDQANMSRFRPIPPHAEVVEFSLKKTSRGEVQQQKVLDRTPPSRGGQPSTSPKAKTTNRKRGPVRHQYPRGCFCLCRSTTGTGTCLCS